jgi:hypothetical protein
MGADEYRRARLPSNPVCFRERSSLPNRDWVGELVGGLESKTRRFEGFPCFPSKKSKTILRKYSE